MTEKISPPHPQMGIEQMLNDVKKVLISGIGGGGDVLTALHVRWALEKIAPHIEWVHGGITGGDINHFNEVIKLDESSAWISENSYSSPPHRLVEAVISKYLRDKVFLLSCHHGTQNMVQSLNKLFELRQIEMAIFIDGGTDSLTFKGSAVVSPVEDTMGLAAIGLGKFSDQLKYRIAGVSVVGSDGEMTLDEIGNQLLKIYKKGGYLGGTFFPVERLQEYAELVTEILKIYPTATALSPLLVNLCPFEWGKHPQYRPFINGFQLATFLFDAVIGAAVGNDFTSMIFEQPSRKAAKGVILNALQNPPKRMSS